MMLRLVSILFHATVAVSLAIWAQYLTGLKPVYLMLFYLLVLQIETAVRVFHQKQLWRSYLNGELDKYKKTWQDKN